MLKSLLFVGVLGAGVPLPGSDASRLPAELPRPSFGAMRHDVADARYLALGSSVRFASVGLLRHVGEARASATLVAPQWVLTAGHAVAGANPDSLTIELGGRTHDVREVVMHPDFHSHVKGNGVDLALMRLAEPVFNVNPAVRYRGYAERGQIGTAVGFGVAGAGANAMTDPVPSGTKRGGTNVIDATGGVLDGRRVPDHLLIADFDRPGDPSHNRLGSPVPLEMEYMPLGGDSGGGLFVELPDGWLLAGVFSGYTFSVGRALEIGMYGSVMFWTRLSLFNDWVDEVTSRGMRFEAESWMTEVLEAR